MGCINTNCCSYLNDSMMAPLGLIYFGLLYQSGFLLVVRLLDLN